MGEWFRNGTIVGPSGTQIDLQRENPEVWITVKADSDKAAEETAAMVLKLLNGDEPKDSPNA